MLKLLLYTTLTNTGKVFWGPLYANLGIVNYNQLHFFGFKKQLIKNTSFNENPNWKVKVCCSSSFSIVAMLFEFHEIV